MKKNRKWFVGLLSLCLSVGIVFGAVTALFGVNSGATHPVVAQAETGWTERNPDRGGYTVNADGSVVSTGNNSGWNFLFSGETTNAMRFYSVSTKISANISTPADGSLQAGLLPWYVDDNNYVIVYVEWWETRNSQNQMREVQITGMVGGTDLGWHDIWTDGITKTPSDGVELKVDRLGDMFNIYLYDAGGNLLKSGTQYFDGVSANDSFAAVYGLYGNGSASTFSDIRLTEWANRAHDKDGYTVDAENVVKARGKDNGDWNFALNGEKTDGRTKYSLSAQISGENVAPETAETHIGLVPWYVDGNNYIVAYAQYLKDDRPAQMRELQITGMVGGNSIGWNDIWTDGVALFPSEGYTLRVDRDGNTFTISLISHSGAVVKTGTRTVDGVAAQDNDNAVYGVYAMGDAGATFRNISFDFGDVSASARLNDAITLRYLVPQSLAAVSAEIGFAGKTYTIEPEAEGTNGNTVFAFTRITPQYMTEKISFIAKDANGNTVARKQVYTLRDYATALLEQYKNDAKMRTLVVDLLRYGAAAQKYRNVNTDDLADGWLTDTQQGWGTTFSAANYQNVLKIEGGTSSDSVKWSSATVHFADRITLVVKFTSADASGVKVYVNGGERTFYEEGGKYVVEIPVSVVNMGTTLQITAKVNGQQTGGTLSYSVDSYIARQYNTSNATWNALVKAFACYGTSVKNYTA